MDMDSATRTAASQLETVEVIDHDLVEQLESAKKSIVYKVLAPRIVEQQRERNEARARRARMTPIARRRDKMREHVQARAFKNEDRHHIHSVLALCGLPYRRPDDDTADYFREYGRNSLVVMPGYLKDPGTGKMVPQGIPYGPKARLLMLHICTTALRQNSHEIELADSLSAFIRELGFPVTGGPRGTIAQFKEQLHRLAGASMKIGLWDGNRAKTINSQPIKAFDVWLPSDPDQKTLWSTKLYLDQDFFQSLKEHALPVNIKILRAFAHSAKQIDMILWLAYRLRSVKKPYRLTWGTLQQQFGADVRSRSRKFRQSFREDLASILEVFPDLPIRLSEDGLFLSPCDTTRLFVPPKT
jgi:hypothetical protein